MSSVLLAAHGQGGGEVDGGRRLTDAAFLIGDGDDHLRVALRSQPDLEGPSAAILGAAAVVKRLASMAAIQQLL